MAVNHLVFQGRLVDVPVFGQTNTGNDYANFRLAWSEKFKDKEAKCFLECKAFREKATLMKNYMNQKGQEISVNDLAADFQGTVADILTSHLMQAAKDYNAKTIVVAGGVSANSGLRSALEKACKKQGCELYLPKLSLCGDNAAMIGSQAYYEYLAGTRAGMDLNGVASIPVDVNYQN